MVSHSSLTLPPTNILQNPSEPVTIYNLAAVDSALLEHISLTNEIQLLLCTLNVITASRPMTAAWQPQS